MESFQLLSSQSTILFFDQSNTHTHTHTHAHTQTHTHTAFLTVGSEEFPWRRDGCTFPSLVFTNHKWSLMILLRFLRARSCVCTYARACTCVCVWVFVHGKDWIRCLGAAAGEPTRAEWKLKTLNINRTDVIAISGENQRRVERRRDRRRKRRWAEEKGRRRAMKHENKGWKGLEERRGEVREGMRL